MRRFESLDGLRGVCALLVTLFHCDAVLRSGHLIAHGYLCVDLFFIMSGFVISFTYEERLNAGLSCKQFAVIRARRLLPVHLVGTAIVSATALTLYLSGKVSLGMDLTQAVTSAALGLILVPYLLAPVNVAFPLNQVLWSLSAEWLVNLFYARGMFRATTLVIIGVCALAFAVTAVFAFINPAGLCIGVRNSDWIFGIFRAIAGFFSGVILCRMFRSGRLNRLPALRPELIYSIVFLMASFPTKTATPAFDVASWAVMPFAVALLIKTDIKPARFLIWLGAISYPLYVVQFVPMWIAQSGLSLEGRHSAALAIPIVLGALLLAWIISKFVGGPSPRPVLRATQTETAF